MTTATLQTGRPSTTKLTDVALWWLQLLLSLTFFMSSFGRLTGSHNLIELFSVRGFGQWFRYVTGALELGGAVALLVPRTQFIGGLLLTAVMLAAAVVHVVVLRTAPPPVLVAMVLVGVVTRHVRRAVAAPGGGAL